MAVARGDTERAAELAATLRKSPEDRRIIGALHACLAEQALYAGDLPAAASEIADGLAVLHGAELAEDEIRLLAIGCRAAADLAARPESARPPDLGARWRALEPDLREPGRGELAAQHGPTQPEVAAYGALAAAEQARQRKDRRPRYLAGRRGGMERGRPALPGGVRAAARGRGRHPGRPEGAGRAGARGLRGDRE